MQKHGLSTTLENHCTRTAQSSRSGCSRRVHKIEYLAVKRGNILVIFFTSENIHRELLSLINPAVYFCGLSEMRYSVRVMQKMCLFPEKEDERNFSLYS